MRATAGDHDSIGAEIVEDSDVPSHRHSSESMLVELHTAHASERDRFIAHPANSEHPFASLEQHPYGYDGHDDGPAGLPLHPARVKEAADDTDRSVVSKTPSYDELKYGADTGSTLDQAIYYSSPADAAPHQMPSAAMAEPTESSQEPQLVSHPPTPRERRRRYRKSSNDPKSDFEAHKFPPTPPYRYLRQSSMTPDHPDHPDHLVYLLSSAQITPSADRSSYQQTPPKRSSRSGYDTPPETPREARPPSSFSHATAGGIGHGLSEYYAQQEDLRAEPETEIDYEAEGRAWMKRLRREKAARDREAAEYNRMW